MESTPITNAYGGKAIDGSSLDASPVAKPASSDKFVDTTIAASEDIPGSTSNTQIADPRAVTLSLDSQSPINQLIGMVVKNIVAGVCVGRLAASQYMKLWMRDLDAQRITVKIVTALRQTTKDLLQAMMNQYPVSSEDLLKIRGNIRDQSQGVYLDIVTTPSDSYGLYTGGAAATMASCRSFRGLYRRIGKHLSKANRESRPCTHYEWIDRPGNKANFVILAVFDTETPKELIYFTEMVMTILFESYDDEGFRDIRPSLPTTGGVPLNRDTPLRTELHADDNKEVAAKRAQGRRDGAAKTALIKQNRSLQTASKGGAVKMIADGGRLRFKVLALPWIGIPQRTAKSWDLKGGDTVNVVYDIRKEGSHKKKFAEDDASNDDGSALGIKVVYKGQEVWLSRKGRIAVKMSNTLVDWLSGLPTDSELLAEDRYPLHTVR
ncbi:hypothetical protein SLS56_001796 [Neofusicoccum ribis]|uniref:Uncharacterized protein n=1 Tax=Neofusicoccum ribis TaxID=45134 RepID=A0ABR3T787_9PEZI